MGISAALVAPARTRVVAKRHEPASTALHPFVDLSLVSPLAIARQAMVDGSCREDGMAPPITRRRLVIVSASAAALAAGFPLSAGAKETAGHSPDGQRSEKLDGRP
jgi:hypothetical protein